MLKPEGDYQTELPLCTNCEYSRGEMTLVCTHPDVVRNADLVYGIPPPCQKERSIKTRRNYNPHVEEAGGGCGRSGRLFKKRRISFGIRTDDPKSI